MAKEYELLPGAARHTFADGTVVEPGGKTSSDQPLDKLYKGKFREVGATKATKPRDHDPTLNESGGRQMDRPEAERQQQQTDQQRFTAGRAARVGKPAKDAKDQEKVATTRVKDFDFPDEDEEKDKADRESTKRRSAATGDDAAKTRHPANEPEEEEDSGDKEEQDAETEEEDENAEGEEVESQFGEDVTTDFRGAKKAGLQVFHDEEAGKFTVVKADRPTKAIHGEELKTKAAVNRLVTDNK